MHALGDRACITFLPPSSDPRNICHRGRARLLPPICSSQPHRTLHRPSRPGSRCLKQWQHGRQGCSVREVCNNSSSLVLTPLPNTSSDLRRDMVLETFLFPPLIDRPADGGAHVHATHALSACICCTTPSLGPLFCITPADLSYRSTVHPTTLPPVSHALLSLAPSITIPPTKIFSHPGGIHSPPSGPLLYPFVPFLRPPPSRLHATTSRDALHTSRKPIPLVPHHLALQGHSPYSGERTIQPVEPVTLSSFSPLSIPRRVPAAHSLPIYISARRGDTLCTYGIYVVEAPPSPPVPGSRSRLPRLFPAFPIWCMLVIPDAVSAPE